MSSQVAQTEGEGLRGLIIALYWAVGSGPEMGKGLLAGG